MTRSLGLAQVQSAWHRHLRIQVPQGRTRAIYLGLRPRADMRESHAGSVDNLDIGIQPNSWFGAQYRDRVWAQTEIN